MLDLNPDIQLHGNADLLRTPLSLILNSRQSKTPVGNDPWVKSTLAAVHAASDAALTLITSVGMNIWELPLWAAADRKHPMVILIPSDKQKPLPVHAREIAADFNIDPDLSLWLSIPPTPGSRGSKGWWQRRDTLALDLAQRIYPVSIRPDGRWANLLASPGASGKEIITDFQTPYPKSSKSIPILPANFTVPPIRPWHYLTHWTRRCYTHWPGESSAEFYRDLAASGDEFPHSARATLLRILRERRIRASTERIRSAADVVAFTAIPPDEALALMKWRGRFARPTFEPYGICFHLSAASAAGIKPVEYLPEGLESDATPEALQQGFGRGFWPAEAEWRATGDVNLSSIDPKNIRILVPTETEISSLSQRSIFKFLPLEKLDLFLPD